MSTIFLLTVANFTEVIFCLHIAQLTQSRSTRRLYLGMAAIFLVAGVFNGIKWWLS